MNFHNVLKPHGSHFELKRVSDWKGITQTGQNSALTSEHKKADRRWVRRRINKGTLMRMQAVITTFVFTVLFITARVDAQETSNPILGDIRQRQPVTGSWNPFRYDAGYVLGTVAQVSARGILIKTLEGQIKLGITSTRGGYVEKDCFDAEVDQRQSRNPKPLTDEERKQAAELCVVNINPFEFSHYNTDLVESLERINGRLVMAFYRSYYLLPLLESSNYIDKVYLVEPDILKPGAVYESNEISFARSVHYGAGSFEGRIVKASLEGIVRKAHEFIIQVGNTGDLFRAVSVSDEELFKFGIQAMSTGRYLQIGYYQLYSPLASPFNLLFGYNTDLRAHRIEVITDPRGDVPSRQP